MWLSILHAHPHTDTDTHTQSLYAQPCQDSPWLCLFPPGTPLLFLGLTCFILTFNDDVPTLPYNTVHRVGPLLDTMQTSVRPSHSPHYFSFFLFFCPLMLSQQRWHCSSSSVLPLRDSQIPVNLDEEAYLHHRTPLGANVHRHMKHMAKKTKTPTPTDERVPFAYNIIHPHIICTCNNIQELSVEQGKQVFCVCMCTCVCVSASAHACGSCTLIANTSCFHVRQLLSA